MAWRVKAAFVPVVCLPLAAACTTAANAPPGQTQLRSAPIVALAADDIGVVASATPQNQGASLSVGYKGTKVAIVPVENRDGKLLIMDTATGEQTYSVFTQLGLDVKGGAARGVAVKQVLAVGPAADAWVKNAAPAPQPLPPGQ